MADNNQTPTLEENFARLEELIRELSAEGVSLEQSFTLYSEGMSLIQTCNTQIDTVEKKVMKLNGKGELEEMKVDE